eukprot:SM000037S13533  [mRNA]  locus=s37:425650:429636:+ [translate_table: standard]
MAARRASFPTAGPLLGTTLPAKSTTRNAFPRAGRQLWRGAFLSAGPALPLRVTLQCSLAPAGRLSGVRERRCSTAALRDLWDQRSLLPKAMHDVALALILLLSSLSAGYALRELLVPSHFASFQVVVPYLMSSSSVPRRRRRKCRLCRSQTTWLASAKESVQQSEVAARRTNSLDGQKRCPVLASLEAAFKMREAKWPFRWRQHDVVST